jgi:hypothetical protein
MSPQTYTLVALAAVLDASSCDPTEPPPADDVSIGDADREDDARADGDATGDADERDDVPALPGPLTLVVCERGVTAERMCDLDGDGSLDNAIANVGSPAAGLLAAVVSAAFQASILDGSTRTVVHFPWVDDPGVPEDPDTAVAAFEGSDTDVPVRAGDDFSGGEAFYARPDGLDGCGEPRVFSLGASLLAGELDARASSLGFDVVALHGDVRLLGSITASGASADLYLCGFATATDLGATQIEDTSWLEAFVAGGIVFGLPEVPGVTPDIDVDGDGIERFILDTDGHVARCVDGDGHTTIEGRECWQDPRIADGFSVTAVLHAVSARFAGREPGWEEKVDGGCDEPPEQSFWDRR